MSHSEKGKLLGDKRQEINRVSIIVFNATEGKFAAQPFLSCLPQDVLDGWMGALMPPGRVWRFQGTAQPQGSIRVGMQQ